MFTYQKTIFTSHRQYLFGLLLSRNVRETHTDESIRKYCYSVWKEKTNKTSNVAAAKIFLLSAYITGTTCFDE